MSPSLDMRNLLTSLVLLASLTQVTVGMACTTYSGVLPVPELPANLIPSGFGPGIFESVVVPGDTDSYKCSAITLVQLEVDGPVFAVKSPRFGCTNTMWWSDVLYPLPVRVSDNSVFYEIIPLQMACVTPPAGFNSDCELFYDYGIGSSSGYALVVHFDPAQKFCRNNQPGVPALGCSEISSVVCDGSEFLISLANGTTFRETGRPSISCKDMSTLTCPLIPEIPANLIPNGYVTESFGHKRGCPGNAGTYGCDGIALVQFDTSSPVLAMHWPYFYCDSSSNKWFVDDASLLPVRITCVKKPSDYNECEVNYVFPGGYAEINPLPPNNEYCPSNKQKTLGDGTPFSAIECSDNGYNVTLMDGTIVIKTYDDVDFYNFNVTCGDVTTTTTTSTSRTYSTRPTTTAIRPTSTSTTTAKPTISTTTVRTTTTIKKDTNPTAAQLWDVNAYYNYGVGVHAFCADQTCINAIQSNGIGYDMTNGKVPVGKAVRESAIAAVRAACPTGSAHLRNLGFTKSGNKYLHNFSGTGLKVGWVSIANGACGAQRQIKRWKSRYTDDMMYDVNLEWNTWYQGMVQDGGKVQFYMWN